MLLFYLILILLTILLYHAFLFFFLIINLCFLIPGVIAQIFNPIAKIVTLIGIPIKQTKAEIEIHSSIHFVLFLQENNFLPPLYFLI